jgi:hypothetical protein
MLGRRHVRTVRTAVNGRMTVAVGGYTGEVQTVVVLMALSLGDAFL